MTNTKPITNTTLQTAPTVGEIAPDFSLKNQNGEEISLYTLLDSGKKVLLVFYPADQTPGCTLQLCGIRDIYAEYQKHNVVVLGINKGSAQSHQDFITAQSYQFDILVDDQEVVTNLYGAKKLFFKNLMTKRGVFLINTDKKIIYRQWGQHDNTKILDVLTK